MTTLPVYTEPKECTQDSRIRGSFDELLLVLHIRPPTLVKVGERILMDNSSL